MILVRYVFFCRYCRGMLGIFGLSCKNLSASNTGWKTRWKKHLIAIKLILHLCILVSFSLTVYFGMQQQQMKRASLLDLVAVFVWLFVFVGAGWLSSFCSGWNGTGLPACLQDWPPYSCAGRGQRSSGKGQCAVLNWCAHTPWSCFHALISHRSLGYFLQILLCSLVRSLWAETSSTASLVLCFKSCSLAPSSVLFAEFCFSFLALV